MMRFAVSNSPGVPLGLHEGVGVLVVLAAVCAPTQ